MELKIVFMVNFEQELNQEQLAVVKGANGPCLVLAGAGSGKTRVITYRVAFLLEQGVKPENILLLTFTNKAAREMLSRVEKICGRQPVGLWGGTFHAVANRLLRMFGKELGYQPNFTVLDEDDSETMIKSTIKEMNFDTKSRRFPSAGLIQSLYSFSRNSLISLEEVIDWRASRLKSFSPDIEEIVKRYGERKKEANVMDFDDLLENWRLLLKGPLKDTPPIRGSQRGSFDPSCPPLVGEELKKSLILTRLSNQFCYILVDEYQDTNRLQAEIVKLLASKHKNLLVVGDDAQSIYSFRAADINNILEFKKDFPKAKIFKLETNYRSTPDILNLANQVISQNVNQFPKNLISPLKPHFKPQLITADSPFGEAEFVVKKVQELKNQGQRLADLAVLFRAAFHAQVLEMELAKAGLPYEFRGGLRFFERAHIKDVLSFLRIANNFRDEVAWWRVLEIFEGIGPETAKSLVAESKNAELLKDFLKRDFSFLSAKAQAGWGDFKNLLGAMEKEDQPEKMIDLIIDSAYGNYLASEYENAEDREDDIRQLGRYASRARDLSSFLADVSLDESYGQRSEAKQDKLILSTIHQAKGLEWEAVFLINLVEGALPNERALKEGAEEEERRLFYVAITRAKRHLFLTCPLAGADFMTACNPSPFLQEIKEDLLERGFSEKDFGQEEVIEVDETGERKGDWRKREFLKKIEEF